VETEAISRNLIFNSYFINPLNAELNPICHLLALLGAHHILHISRIRVNIKKSDIIVKTVIICNSSAGRVV